MTNARIFSSRPIRALVMVLFAWSGGRATYEYLLLFEEPRRLPPATAERPTTAHRIESPNTPQRPMPSTSSLKISSSVETPQRLPFALARSRFPRLQPESAESPPTLQHAVAAAADGVEPKQPDPPQPATQRRLSISTWFLGRDGASGLVPAGTLGGAQMGLRANLPITQAVSATARISTPLRASGGEASFGIAVRQGPVTLLLERRIALDRGGRNDFSTTFAAGIDAVRLPQRFRLDAYGQAGLVGRDPFADGAVRIERPIATVGKTEIAIGAGLWGGAQPGVSRLDTGPQIVVRMPIAGSYVRASGEWRHRVAGRAQPNSGPAVTLGMDF